MTFDIVIIGAGIVGAACAYRLSQEGFSVAVVDGGSPACGSTSAAMGHIVVMDDNEAEFALTNYSNKLWHHLLLILVAFAQPTQQLTSYSFQHHEFYSRRTQLIFS